MLDDGQSVADSIQKILDKDNGFFMSISNLLKFMNKDMRTFFGIKRSDNAKTVSRKLEEKISDRFIFREKLRGKNRICCILTPCDPAEIVLALLNDGNPPSPKQLAQKIPFTQKELCSILNELAGEGKIKTLFTENLEPKIYAADSRLTDTSGYTIQNFRKAYDDLHRTREFVRICDLRRQLQWPRETFDEMIRHLRDNEIIQIYLADDSSMTEDERQDCFVDENYYRMGSMTWND